MYFIPSWLLKVQPGSASTCNHFSPSFIAWMKMQVPQNSLGIQHIIENWLYYNTILAISCIAAHIHTHESIPTVMVNTLYACVVQNTTNGPWNMTLPLSLPRYFLCFSACPGRELCEECRKALSTCSCRKCDNAVYCDRCFDTVHRGSKPMMSHQKRPFNKDR